MMKIISKPRFFCSTVEHMYSKKAKNYNKHKTSIKTNIHIGGTSIMSKFEISQVSGIRGFNELTQGETDVEAQLLDNCNRFNNTRRGFVVTRVEVLSAMDDATIARWVDLCLSLTNEQLKMDMFKNAVHFMAKTILRDHCTVQIAETLRQNTVNRFNILGKDTDAVVASISKYLKCGRVVPVAQTYREALEELEKGVIIYEEPRND
ncbi:TPA: hypothetical protein ROX91_001960 [Bacillus cereus]|nr:hypothetical protein [Bacillus cereus]